jgi:hypothetical protein
MKIGKDGRRRALIESTSFVESCKRQCVHLSPLGMMIIFHYVEGLTCKHGRALAFLLAE